MRPGYFIERAKKVESGGLRNEDYEGPENYGMAQQIMEWIQILVLCDLAVGVGVDTTVPDGRHVIESSAQLGGT
jgi:hypothetical protein